MTGDEPTTAHQPSAVASEHAPLAGRVVRVVAAGTSPVWAAGLLAQLDEAGATTELTVLDALGPCPGDAGSGAADVVVADSPDTAAALRSTGLDRFLLWTVVQSDPSVPLTASEARDPRCARAVEDSRRVLVFDEQSRSAVESAVWQAAGKVVVLPRLTAAELAPARPATAPSVPGDAVLVLHGELIGTAGAALLEEHSERVRPLREPAPILVVADEDTSVAVRTDPDRRHLAALPGARFVADGPALHTALAGRRGLTLAPRGARTSDIVAWADRLGLDVWTEAGALAPQAGGHGVRLLGAPTVSEALTRAGSSDDSLPDRGARRPVNRTARAFLPHLVDAARVPVRSGAPLRVLLVGADFKFLGDLVEALIQRPDVDVKVDRWKTNGDRPTPHSEQLLAWADVVVTEFASRNAVWASRAVRPHQRLILHLHGFELRNPLVHEIAFDAVEAVVLASRFYRADTLATTGWPAERAVVIPNTVQSAELARPKHPDARFHLGLAGYVPELKRMDRALDLLSELLRRDPRYVLHLRGRHPWNYKYVWGNPLRRDVYLGAYERLRVDPELRRAVVFDPFGPDMGNWFRGIGWMLSPSTRETFHLAPVEGMASGAVPVVWRRQGADEIFPADALVDDLAQAADRVHAAATDPAEYARLAQEAVEHAARYEAADTVADWLRLILDGTRPGTPVTEAEMASARPPASALAGRADWGEIGALVADGRVAQARVLAEEERRPAWSRPDGVRRLAAHVERYPALAQRAHALVDLAPTRPPLRPDADGPAAVVADPACASRAVGQGPLVVSGPHRDDVDASLASVVDALVRRALTARSASVTAVGDEVAALAGATAARWLGVPFTWDLAGRSDVAALLEAARRSPHTSDERARVALIAAAAAVRVHGAPGAGAPVPVPLESLIAGPDLARARRIGVVGSALAQAVLRPGCEAVALEPADGRAGTTQGVDAALIDLEAIRRGGWRVDGGNAAPLGALITALHRASTPIALIDTGSRGLSAGTIAQARRVDAVVAAGPEDVQLLQDRRIVPSQVAVSTAPWAGTGVDGAEALLDVAGRVELALRMLHQPGGRGR